MPALQPKDPRVNLLTAVLVSIILGLRAVASVNRGGRTGQADISRD